MRRKDFIIKELKKNNKPVSAAKLAAACGVSRQVIVGDVALLRASGINIIATPRGYLLEENHNQKRYTIAVIHQKTELKDELYTIVDLGGYIEDVIIDHPVYGQITGKLHLSSRYDVDQFVEKTIKENAQPLSHLTNGLHLHTLQCPNNETYLRILDALDQKGYLLKKDD